MSTILDNEPSMNASNNGFWSGGPKAMFFTGLSIGVAVSAVLGLSIVLAMVWNGKGLSNGGANAYAAANNPSPVDPYAQQPSGPPAGPVKEVGESDHVRGPANARVTLIEYSDFECPFCKRHAPTIDQALREYPNDVRLVYRHYPLTSIHQNAQKAAEASECAAKLGGNDAFWKMHDKIFEKSPAIGADALVATAREIGLNEAAFKSCLDSGEMANRVNDDVASGNDSGVEGTPATFVNGKLISGAVPFESLKAEIEAAKNN